MKRYRVQLTADAYADMQALYEHIAYILMSPGNAQGQYRRIAEAIKGLDIMPERFQLMDSEPERARGIRRMPVDNYNVFYTVQAERVVVLNVLYGGSDTVSRLNKEDL